MSFPLLNLVKLTASSVFGTGFAEGLSVKADKASSPDLDDSDDEDEQYDTDWDMSTTDGSEFEAEGLSKEANKQATTEPEQSNTEPSSHQRNDTDGSQPALSSDPDVAMASSGYEKDLSIQASMPSTVLVHQPVTGGLGTNSELPQLEVRRKVSEPTQEESNRTRRKVFVNDAAYSTYRAVLFYVGSIRLSGELQC